MKKTFLPLLPLLLLSSCGPKLDKLGADIQQQEQLRLQVMAPKFPGVASVSIDSLVFTHERNPIQGHFATTWTLTGPDSTLTEVKRDVEVQYINVEYGHSSWTCNWLGAYTHLMASRIAPDNTTSTE